MKVKDLWKDKRWRDFLFDAGLLIAFAVVVIVLSNCLNAPAETVGPKVFPIDDCGDFLPMLLQFC